MDKFMKLVPVLLPLAVVVALSFPVLALGVRFGWWGLALALPLLAGAALTAAIMLALAGVAVLLALRRHYRQATQQGVWVILVLAVPVAMVFHFGLKASQVPVLYDIATTWDNPPPISSQRPPGANPPQSAASNREPQQAFYPDLGPLMLAEDKAKVVARIQQAASELGWQIVAVDPDLGLVEATDTTFWFGFVDDITVRVTGLAEGGSRVDVRSVSRVGKSDLGKNAERIRAFLAELRV